MALARSWSVALLGLDGHLVEVEADLAQGLPGLTLIGLPDAALHEARDRVRAAIVNSGESWPARRITLGLSPATLPKRGSGFDLAMAAAILAAAGVVPGAALAGVVLLGELALDGRVRHLRGVLPAVLAAARAGVERVVVPAADAAEAALVPGVDVRGVPDLRSLLRLLRGEPEPDAAADVRPSSPGEPSRSSRPSGSAGSPASPERQRQPGHLEPPDLRDVLGQSLGRRALEVAAAGGHHLYLLGPPGAGKTMLAERLPGLLPALDDDAALEVSAIHSVAGELPPDAPLVRLPPFRSPHHTASVSALVGGGPGVARPGEVSLAHRGVLFLDEAPEFPARSLDALRQPLEAGVVTIARAGGTARYPARPTLVLAANPCPCAVSSGDGRTCLCPPLARRRYLSRLSGPLLDRVDLRLELYPVTRADLAREEPEPTAVVAARVAAARERAAQRLRGTPWRTNAEVPGRELRDRFLLDPDAVLLAERRLDTGQLTARGVDRVLRVAWTLADLAGRARPGADEVREALGMRQRVAA